MSWFTVDKEGLSKLLAGRGKEMLLFELLSNAWDTDSRFVMMELVPVPKAPKAKLTVTDNDPNGFQNLSHAFTLFAESIRKGDPEKRGRFNLGEKLVLACCEKATIMSTTGCVIFNPDGTRTKTTRMSRLCGTSFEATLRMTRAEMESALVEVRKTIPPVGVRTIIRTTPDGPGEELPQRKPVAAFEATLQTVLADEEGNLRSTRRKTEVRLYEPLEGEEASIYEMGIPVVETGDRWHVDVQQKVPLTVDRTNVPPSFLRRLRAFVLNEAGAHLSDEDSTESWVTQGLTDKEVSSEAVKAVVDKRYGKKVVSHDPSDREANNRAASKGYKVLHGGSLPKAAWENIRQASAVSSAGKRFPTPKPYSDDPNADPVQVLSESDYTPNMYRVVALTKRLAEELMGKRHLQVKLVRARGQFGACYSKTGGLDYNVDSLGKKFFDGVETDEGMARILDLMVHEFGHEYASNHLSEEYYEALTRLAGKLGVLASRRPELLWGAAAVPPPLPTERAQSLGRGGPPSEGAPGP